MSADAISAIGEGVPRYSHVERLQQMATETGNSVSRTEAHGGTEKVANTVAAASSPYSPIVYAHAAAHAQAGIVAALISSPAAQVAAANNKPEDIHAVEAAEGSHIDRYA